MADIRPINKKLIVKLLTNLIMDKMINKFKIGITDDTKIMRCRLIVKLIEMCGATPVLIPAYVSSNLEKEEIDDRKLAQLKKRHLEKVDTILNSGCDALIFPGNKRDVNPALYGAKSIHPETEKRLPRNRFNVRQEVEIAMLEYALKKQNIPVLGICGGMQIINAVLGGSLVQHLPEDSRTDNSKQENYHYDERLKHLSEDELQSFEDNFESIVRKKLPNIYNGTHEVKVDPDSLLAKIYQENDQNIDLNHIRVLSIHHQGCFEENLSDQLKPVAVAPDGVIEAVEHKNYPKMFLLTQFHPECNASGIALNLVQNLIDSIKDI